MQLPPYVDYSLLVLLYLSRAPNKFATITEISEYYQIPKNHLTKVVQSLTQLGFIINVKEKSHGIKLAKTPSKISIGEVMHKLKVSFCLI
ncbi:MAG: Rrf2 family transcriptional regulator [Gammaproteobacteria bacterium]|nr:Rrf2 family transcriptional regulator [Gammaproteobacteria bacterium]MCW5583964.1 Rrf2 family transcriptional regulator [Gammaproteobacteria bacterium]